MVNTFADVRRDISFSETCRLTQIVLRLILMRLTELTLSTGRSECVYLLVTAFGDVNLVRMCGIEVNSCVD